MKTISITIPEYQQSVKHYWKLLFLILIAQIALVIYPVNPVFNFISNIMLQAFFWIIIVDFSMGR